VLCLASILMIFGGLPMISLCHSSITDRRVRAAAVEAATTEKLSIVGTRSKSSASEVNSNPLHRTNTNTGVDAYVVSGTEPRKVEETLIQKEENFSSKLSWGDYLFNHMTRVCVSFGLIAFVK
jgi:hypothetical protein